MFEPLDGLPIVISLLPSARLYKPADYLEITCWSNGSCNVRMSIIRGTPCCRSEISGEGKARGYDKVMLNRLMPHSQECKTRSYLEHFPLSRGMTN
jgi:hypothetical protein